MNQRINLFDPTFSAWKNHYVQQITDVARELPEEKLRTVERALQLKSQARPVAEAQYQDLLQAIQAAVDLKNIVVEDFPTCT